MVDLRSNRRLMNLAYGLYERRLLRELRAHPMPAHVAIIIDGNRRHARRYGMTDPATIYAQGAHKLDEILDWCSLLQISAVTLWVLSTENFNRPADQVTGILAAIETKIRALTADPQIHRQRVRIRAIGRLELLPDSTATALRAAIDATATYDGMVLTIAVAYGGRAEIVDAVRAFLCAEQSEGATLDDVIAHIDADAISAHLYMAGMPDPDLIIRTSGEVRLSGFLMWQSAYSEFYFSDVYWPAFRKIDFLRAIRSYQQRHRRFGS